MGASDTAISDLSLLLQGVLADVDIAKFRELLRGRHLPALGGDASPAEILGQAIEEAPDFQACARGTAYLLAAVLGGEARRLRETGGRLDGKSRTTVLNALRLAASLPAENFLAISLRALLITFRSSEDLEETPFILWHALWRALARQQVDDSLESEWFALLVPPQDGAHEPEWQTLALEAWRGLLKIPPSSKAERTGEIIDFDRVERGFMALNEVAAHQDRPALLRLALEILVQTYPRSAEFWVTSFSPLLPRWPSELREAVLGRWPELSQALAQEIERFDEIYFKRRDKILYLFTLYGFSNEEAEDLCWEVFMRLFKRLPSLRDEPQVEASLLREAKYIRRIALGRRERADQGAAGLQVEGSSLVIERSLLLPQRHHRVRPHRPLRRDPGGEEGHGG